LSNIPNSLIFTPLQDGVPISINASNIRPFRFYRRCGVALQYDGGCDYLDEVVLTKDAGVDGLLTQFCRPGGFVDNPGADEDGTNQAQVANPRGGAPHTVYSYLY
jgi:hypothetical protein